MLSDSIRQNEKYSQGHAETFEKRHILPYVFLHQSFGATLALNFILLHFFQILTDAYNDLLPLLTFCKIFNFGQVSKKTVQNV